MKCDSNCIEIIMPCNADYAGILRLAAAGSANGAGFDMEMIDDVKILVSEVFNSMLYGGVPSCKTSFQIGKGSLRIDMEACDGRNIWNGANEMTLPILKALSQKTDLTHPHKVTLVIA